MAAAGNPHRFIDRLPEPMMKLLMAEGARRGYEPDAADSLAKFRRARPEPWMCLEIARRLRVYPMEAGVKIGDTLPDIDESTECGHVDDRPGQVRAMRSA